VTGARHGATHADTHPARFHLSLPVPGIKAVSPHALRRADGGCTARPGASEL